MNQFDAAIAALSAEIAAEREAIDAQRKDLEGRERGLEAKEQALDVLSRYATALPEPMVAHQEPTALQARHQPDAEFDINDLDVDGHSQRKTFVDDVRNVVRRFGRQEFTNAHVEAAMKRLGIGIVGKTPRQRISLAFTKLVEERVIVRSFIGGGNVAHRYKLRDALSPDELSRYEAMNGATGDESTTQTTLDDQDQPSTDNVVKFA